MSLGIYSRQFHQGRNVLGNHAAEFFCQHVAHTQQIFCFGPIQTAVTDFLFQLFLSQRSHLLRGIQPRKNAGSNFVDSFVSTLGRHDDGTQQFKRRIVMQGRADTVISSCSWVNAPIFSGVFSRGKMRAVILLIRSSVHWADMMTAHSNSKGEL